jgi:putative oxidoreductase
MTILLESRYVLPALGRLWEQLEPLAYPLVRCTAGFIYALHALARLRVVDIGGPTIESTGQFMDRFGLVPGLFWTYCITALEFVGGVLLILGLFTRPVAALFVGFMTVATFYVNARFGFWARDGGLEYPLILLALAVAFLIRGGGPYSVDQRVGREI